MDVINTITNLITTIGFPIVCVIYLWKDKTTTQEKLIQAINNNTAVISKLYDKISNEKEGKHDE